MDSGKLFLATTALASAFSASSCVNETYDFTKPIDTTIAIDGDISMPLVKNTKFIEVASFLELDNMENSPLIRVAKDDGTFDYVISMKSDEPFGGNFGKLDFDLSESFRDFVPQGLSTERQDLTGYIIDLKTAIDADPDIIDNVLGQAGLPSTISIVGKTPNEIKAIMDAVDEELKKYSFINFSTENIKYPDPLHINVAGNGENGMPIDIVYNDFPALIEDIGAIETSIDLTFRLGPSFGKIVLEKGFEIGFPDRIHLEALENSEYWKLENENTVRITSDFPIYENTELKFRITGIDASGCIKTGPGDVKSLEINEMITVSGNTVCDIKELLDDGRLADSPIPDALRFETIIALGDDIKIGNVQVKLDLSSQMDMIEDQEIELGQILPETISPEDIYLDIYNPVIILDIVNDSPLAATLKGTIDAYKNGKSVFKDAPISLDGLVRIEAEGSRRISISRRGSDRADVDEDIKIRELGDLIASLPEKITIENIGVTPDDGYTSINVEEYSTKELGFSCNYEVYAPLAFGDDLKINYALEPISELNSYFNVAEGGTKVKLNELNIDFNIENSLPLALGIEVTPLDVDGKEMPMDGINLEIKFDNQRNEILSGNSKGMQKTAVSVSVAPESYDVLKKLDGVAITLKGNAGDAAGIALNSAQGVMITDMSAHISGGIEMDLMDLMEPADDEYEE